MVKLFGKIFIHKTKVPFHLVQLHESRQILPWVPMATLEHYICKSCLLRLLILLCCLFASILRECVFLFRSMEENKNNTTKYTMWLIQIDVGSELN